MTAATRIFAIVVLVISGVAHGHGLLLDVESNGDVISGTAYYTNGDRAAGQSVIVRDLNNVAAEPVSIHTDAKGNFKAGVQATHRYVVSVYGDEGHQVDIELTATTAARPQLVDTSAETHTESTPPAWAVLGAALLISIVPAVLLRNRRISRDSRPAQSS